MATSLLKPVKPTIITDELPPELFNELAASIKGPAYRRADPQFAGFTRLFNGNVKNESKAVVLPLDAADVSQIIQFCTRHSLSPSVKAGGYGTGGWAINGDLVIDLSRMDAIAIEPPNAHTPLADAANPTNITTKGKGPLGAVGATGKLSPSLGSKRRLTESGVAANGGSETTAPVAYSVRMFDHASPVVASFLHGAALPQSPTGEPERVPPISRRKLNSGEELALAQLADLGRQRSGDSEDSSGTSASASADSGASSETGMSTPVTTPPTKSPLGSPPRIPATPRSPDLGRDVRPLRAPPADPFGYMTTDAAPAQLASPPPPPPPAWGSVPAGAAATPLFTHPQHAPAPLPANEPVHAHAYVSFGAGARQKQVDQYTAAHPLAAVGIGGAAGAVPYHVPFSAHPVGSSVMLLGGFGFLSRMYGLSIDNLVEAEVVLADGRIVYVNKDEHPELWWGLRGAGTALGIATRYKAKAYPVPVVFAGNLIYRFHRSTAPSLIRHFRDCVKGAPRELYANVLLTAGPAGKDSLVVIQICYVGPKEKGVEYLQAISAWNGERCLLNEVDEKSFLNQQDSVAQVLRGKMGNQWFIRSALTASFTDEVINNTVIEFADTPIGCTWLFELAGGAIADFDDNCVPKPQREAAFTIAALHQWDMSIDDPKCVDTAEDWLSNTISSVAVGGAFPSFLGRHEIPERVVASYGANWERLAKLKSTYDPQGLFRNSFWPLDGEGELVDPRTHEPATP
ncbi:hypothetical protein FA95DRAFT_1501917 [Auriscalpium vulgare]|uniref:Uncharacterized protein n=1 Tax=Auriscalpium vulgare TaxID=40419 RepID=A0ACB8RAG8_9AGAM|nr:hypothetical protein FA95DRAFT_1501917 [Auriscalpium vulgare]